MTGTQSLIGRLFWRMGLTMLFAVALVVAFLLYEFRSHIDSLRDRSLDGQAEDVARYLRWDGGAPKLELPASLALAYRAGSRLFRYLVLDENGRVLLSMPPAEHPLYFPEEAGTSVAGLFRVVEPESGGVFLGATVGVSHGGERYWVQTAQSARHTDVLADTIFGEIAEKLVWIAILIFAMILVVTYWTLKRVLAPVVAVSREAAAIGPDTLHQRLSLENMPYELTPLLEAVNSALDRLEKAYHLQREFTANAAHEMRTPIAVLQTHLQTLDNQEQVEGLLEELGQLSRMVSQLLKLAQMDRLALSPGQTADLHDVAVDVAAMMAPVAISQGKTLAVTGAQKMPVNGDPDALGMAVRNLVENGLAHSPNGGEVEIHVGQNSTLRVSDHGDGVPPENRTKIFERFWRSDRKDDTGAGLGLSIVSRIVSAHNAAISVADTPDGGATFTITFPAANRRPVRVP